LFHVEGFCPNGICTEKFKAHCPIPIYLVFNSTKVLSIPEIRFSEGNLGSKNPGIYDNIDNFKNLPFDQIYHRGAIRNESLKRSIIHHRCAEVFLRDGLPLENNLSFIICRSEGERETLINKISQKLQRKYAKNIIVSRTCFLCKRQFISKVILDKKTIEISYNSPQSCFKFEYIVELENGRKISKIKDMPCKGFNLRFNEDKYVFKIFIDGHIAYFGEFIDYPF